MRMRWTGHITHVWKTGNAHRILAGNPEEKRSLWR